MLADFLDAAVQITNHALQAQNFLSIEAQNDAQHAVRGGMLRPHIDDEFVRIQKRLLGSFEIEMRERSVRVGHFDLTELFTGRSRFPG
jgi:hypothetical protein